MLLFLESRSNFFMKQIVIYYTLKRGKNGD